MIEDLIQEGVYDPGIFKAVFLMGGPGSGKSTVVNQLSLKALGLKIVNTDKSFETWLKKGRSNFRFKNLCLLKSETQSERKQKDKLQE